MGNYYHLFIQTPEANLVEGMKWFQNTVTRRFNVRHREWGRLFGDRYKAVVVDGRSPYYYETLWDYIHLNPSRARLMDVTRGQSVLDYPWSSIAGGYALMPHQRAKWLAAEQGLATMGVEDTVAGRKKWLIAWTNARPKSVSRVGLWLWMRVPTNEEAICDAAGIGENSCSPRSC